MTPPGTTQTPCGLLASLLSEVNANLNSINTLIALDEADIALSDPQFPQWTIVGVAARWSQLQPGPLADKYKALFSKMCTKAGYEAGVTAIATAQQLGGCLNNGT